MNDPLQIALDWQGEGRKVALAIVVATWGSAPRPAGSVMCCDDAGHFAGSVSGGCVEVAVIEAAREVLATARSRVMEFGVSDEQAWSVGLACGGSLRVVVLPVQREALEALRRARVASRAAVLAVSLDDGSLRVIDGAGAAAGTEWQQAAALALATDAAVCTTLGGRETLLAPQNPPLRLIIVGAVHIAEALCAMARIAGHAVTLVDPRSAFLRAELFPGVALTDRWPQEALPALAIDARCAAVLLTHDPKIDDPAIECLLRSPAYYIGALGSRRTHARRLERLAARGFGTAELARIHGPAGLPIGARTPAEIAVSVLAQITAALRTAAETPGVGRG
jgi:xanthine dehydrogenase accessory factor